MKDLLPFLIVGLVSGSLYGLAGVGLSLTFRTSGIFNFAHGAVGAAAAYFFYDLHVVHRWPWPVAFLAVMVIWGAIAGVALERLTRGLAQASVATIVVVTVGLLLMVQGLIYVHYGTLVRNLPPFLPKTSVEFAGVNVTYGQMMILGGTGALTGALYAFLRLTRLGLSMRAVVESPEIFGLTGQNPTTIRQVSWVIGSAFAALSGMLLAPTIGLEATLLTLLVVQAFGAVAIGRFASMPLTYLGGLATGVIAAVASKYLASKASFRAVPSAVPFLILFSVLIATPVDKLPTALGRLRGASPANRRVIPAKGRWVIGAGIAVGLTGVPELVGVRLPVYTNALSLVVIFLSLALLVNISGQLSLSHAAFAAIGATTFSHLTGGGVPWLVALVLAGAVVVPVGALLALPAMRLSGVYLALATFGFGILMHKVIFNTFLMFGNNVYITAPRPKLGSIDGTNDKTFYFIVLAVVAVTVLAVALVVRSRLGRLLRAMAESPAALTTSGLGVNVTKVLVFCISGFFAGIGGALIISQTGLARSDAGFTPFESLLWLVVLTIGGSGALVPAFVAAALYAVAPSYLDWLSVEWQSALFGASAVAIALLFRCGGGDRRDIFRRLAVQSEKRWERTPLRRTRLLAPVGASPYPEAETK